MYPGASQGTIEFCRNGMLSRCSVHLAYNARKITLCFTARIIINSLSETTMKKLLIALQIMAVALCYAGAADASGGHGKKKGHHKFKHGHRDEVVHYYVPAPPPAPARYYSAPQPQPYYPQARDRRSTSGLAGSVVGGALGYQVGNGNPIAAGVGAAAGSLIGNEIGK